MTIKTNKRVETWTIYTDQNSKQWWLKRIRKLKHEQYIQNKIVRSARLKRIRELKHEQYTEYNSKQWRLKWVREFKHEQYIQQ